MLLDEGGETVKSPDINVRKLKRKRLLACSSCGGVSPVLYEVTVDGRHWADMCPGCAEALRVALPAPRLSHLAQLWLWLQRRFR